jgi:hypothetical protein
MLWVSEHNLDHCLDVQEEIHYRPDDTVAFSSQSRQFRDWIRGGKYKSLVMDTGGSIFKIVNRL